MYHAGRKEIEHHHSWLKIMQVNFDPLGNKSPPKIGHLPIRLNNRQLPQWLDNREFEPSP
jgi:hypothetical protein